MPWLGPVLASWIIRAFAATMTFKMHDETGLLEDDSRNPFLFAFWHNRILMMPYLYERYFSKRPLVVMISESRDGEMIANTASRFGIEAARGSSSGRGVKALIQLTRDLIKAGKDAGVTPDGPRGPVYSVQEGIVHLAKSSGLPVIPITYHLRSKWEMKSWDRFQIPKPFTHCDVYIKAGIPADHPDIREEIKKSLGT
ncbi:MAG: lysophospholipid acyltransferase family protein [Verrucomicrobiota bacterium]